MKTTVAFSNAEAIRAIDTVYLHGDLHLDVCFRTGSFYQGSGVFPEIRQDIVPCDPSVLKIDCRDTGHPDCCVRSIMFDPPWLVSSGSDAAASQNRMQAVYGGFSSPVELFAFQDAAIAELGRILIPGGLLVSKLQDCTHGRQRYFLSIYQVNQARAAGLMLIDSLILVGGAGYRAPGSGSNSLASQHCFFHVYRKIERRQRIVRY